MKTETATYQTERLKRTTTPVYLARFFHVKKYGDSADFQFSVDFTTANLGTTTPPNRPYLQRPSGNTQSIEPENGRSSIGTFLLKFVDLDGEVLRYLSAGNLTLKDAVTVSSPANGGAIAFNETDRRLPKQGTIEITTLGVVERVRYADSGPGVVTGITRAVDGTSAAAHSANDPVTNGEQIRPGTRVQLFAGYAGLAVADFMSFVKMEVVGRSVEADGITFDVQIADVQRSLRRQVFLAATTDKPLVLAGNPVDLALAVLVSTGGRVAGGGTVKTTAASATVTGIGTSFTTFLAVGDAVRVATGEILRVSSITNDTTFVAVQAAILSGDAQAYWKGGPAGGRYDLLAAEDGLATALSLVDVTGLESLRDIEFSTNQYIFSITDKADGKAALETEIWKTLEAYPIIKQDGKYSAKRYKGLTGTSALALGENDILSAGWSLGDQRIINVVSVDYDWDLPSARGQFGTRQIYSHGDAALGTGSIGKHGRRPPLVIQSGGIRTANGGQAILDDRAREITRRFADPPPVLVLDLIYRNHVVEIGDKVDVTHSQIPNIRTGLRGMISELFEVVDLSPLFDQGRIRLSLLWIGAMTDPGAPTSGGAVSIVIPIRGYKVTANVAVFSTFTSYAAPGWVVIGVDTTDSELDWLSVDNATADVFWGETNFVGGEVTALGSKFVGTYGISGGCVFDGTNLQVALVDDSVVDRKIQYARLNKDGTVLQSPIDKFVPAAGSQYAGVAITKQGSSLFWAWQGDDAVRRKIRFGKTDLTGTVQTGDTLVFDQTTGTVACTGIVIVTDSAESSYLFWSRKPTGSADFTEIWYVKVSAAGAIQAGPNLLFSVRAGQTSLETVGAVLDSKGELNVILKEFTTAGVTKDATVLYALLKTDGTVIVQPVPFALVTQEDGSRSSAVAIHPTTDDLFMVFRHIQGAGFQLIRLSFQSLNVPPERAFVAAAL